ncbi:DUF7827 domain-containing protein [Halorientalis salina]|uniref:DUF7827 domain-containing protein n=1 Tax=Halorientalis salina TaxID=2932266 RepID=UPI0010AD3040|nr:BGTF surface domain-containing protein [Halorientalis salina]
MTETTHASILVSLLLCAGLVATGPVSGVALAGHDDGEHHHDGYDFDANLTSSVVHWQGQDLYVQGNASEVTYELHSVSDSGGQATVDEFVDTVTLDERASAVVDSSSLEPGEYVLLDDEDRVVRTNDRGVQTGTAPQSDTDAVDEAAFRIAEQEFSVTPEQDTSAPGSSLDFDVDSNRGEYDVEITATDVSSGELREIFGGTETDDGTRVSEVSDEIEADLTDVDTGTYTFTFSVTDTDEDSTATITVSEAEEMAFVDDNVRAAAGDTRTIDISTEPGDSGTLVVGSADKGYRAEVEFEDGDDDGRVSLTVNTFLAGNRTGSGERTAWSADDGDVITGVDLTTPALDEHLAATDYEMAVNSGGELQDVGLFDLHEPSVSNLTLRTAPERQYEDSLSEMTRTRTDRVAVDDVLIADVNATGVFGLLDAQPGDDDTERFRSLVGSRNASFWLELDETLGNQQPRLDTAESFENDAIRAYPDPENGTITVVMDEASLAFRNGQSSIQTGERYEVWFELDGDSAVVSSDQPVSSTVEFTERTATIETGESDQLWLPATRNATVDGSTTVAPGTEIGFNYRLDGLLSGATETEVRSNGTFAALVDLSDTDPGTNVSVSLRDFDAEAGGVVQAASEKPSEPMTPITESPITTTERSTGDATETTTEETTETTAEPVEPTTTTAGTVTATNASDEPRDTTAGNTTEDGAGFTVGVALLALLGVVLLGVRRQP